MQVKPGSTSVLLPHDEAERLKVLDSYSILDTEPEPVFDSLTELAASFFQVPICLIALIGEHRQVFKSAFGTELRESARENSLCSHALLQDEPIVVFDTTTDPRFLANRYVVSAPGIRFYAGVPLVTSQGYKLGTFCIFDTVVRSEFSSRESDALKHFAYLASRAIEQRLLPLQVAEAEKEALEAAYSVKQILESVPQSVFLLNKNWELIFLNQRAVEVNAQGRDLIGANLWETFPGLIGTAFEEQYRKAARDRVAVSFEEYYPRLNSYFKAHAHPSGEGIAVFLQDVTEQRVVEASLQRSEERYRLATQSPSEGIWDWDQVTGEAYFSARWQEIAGFPYEAHTGHISHFTNRIYPKDAARMQEYYSGLVGNDLSEFNFEHRVLHVDGHWRWTRNHGTVVRDDAGGIVRIAGSISDITATKSTDPLTGLHNRASLLEKIEHRMENVPLNGRTFAVLILDLNLFKRINDSFGQSTGDEVLIEVGRRLESTLGTAPGSIAVRTSGDEFAILIDGIATVEDAVTYANLLPLILEQSITCQGEQLTVSASIGLAMGDEGYSSPEKILEDADVAMHQAKESGKGNCVVFGAHMRERTRRRVQLERDLRDAVAGNQLTLHYQPKVLLETGTILGFESLVRWIHPTRGTISPGELIPYAEESGLIVEIGHWTLRESIRQLMAWRSAGLTSENLTMSVNLSTRQFEDIHLVREIQNVLSTEGAPATCLSLEVTESALFGNMIRAKEILDSLRHIGVSLDMDDFGTGYSSLSYLHRLPFNSLKIDQSFVRELEQSRESRAIAKSIIHLGESLDMVVIAEGVETVPQRDLLIDMGCLYGQGYLFSKPLAADAMGKLLKKTKLAEARNARPPRSNVTLVNSQTSATGTKTRTNGGVAARKMFA
jgi:diguanylate cyclase (GGDEF)-like protein/PAS domain S-box-containing protein